MKIIVFDSETANGLDFPLAYDAGLVVVDTNGWKILEEESYVIYNIYAKERELMKSAYYADKLPKYEEALKKGDRKMIKFFTLKKKMKSLFEEYGIERVYAYNMNFDKRALNNTERFTTNEKYKWFFPKGTKFCCIWHLACQVLLNRPSYIKMALKNNWLTESGNIKTNAECCYRYITKNVDFVEEHQGLEDVKIELEILKKCFAQHKKMNHEPYQACWRIVKNKREELGLA